MCIFLRKSTHIQTFTLSTVDVEDIFSDDFDMPELEELRSMLETASESVEFEVESPRQVAALFKRFIHDLPKPLIKGSTLTMFMISGSFANSPSHHFLERVSSLLLFVSVFKQTIFLKKRSSTPFEAIFKSFRVST